MSTKLRYATAMGLLVAMYTYRRLRNNRKQESMIDDTMAASFPASDPPPF